MQMFHSALSKFQWVQAGPAAWILQGAFLLGSFLVSSLLSPLAPMQGREEAPRPSSSPWPTENASLLVRRGEASESADKSLSFFSLWVGMFVIINLITVEVNMITVWLRLCLKCHSRFLSQAKGEEGKKPVIFMFSFLSEVSHPTS